MVPWVEVELHKVADGGGYGLGGEGEGPVDVAGHHYMCFNGAGGGGGGGGSGAALGGGKPEEGGGGGEEGETHFFVLRS